MKGRRYFLIGFIIAIFVLLAFSRLFLIQVVKGNEYLETSQNQVVKTTVVKAPRGEIYDRYGRALVKNRMAVSVVLSKWKDADDESINQQVSSLVQLISTYDPESFVDTFPISEDGTAFTFEEADDTNNKEKAWKEKYEVPTNYSAKETVDFFAQKYSIDKDYSAELRRRITGIRYEMDLRGFSTSTPFTLSSDVSTNTLAVLKEHQSEYPYVDVALETTRDYTHQTLAAHVLGRVGKISSDEYAELKDQGYSMNDSLGKQGIEKYLEEYLRGTDGVTYTQRRGNVEVPTAPDVDAIPGNNATLTLDLDLQVVAEKTLKDTIMSISANSKDGKGIDANAGSVIAMNPNTGEILAMASYPSYDPTTFQADYSKLLKNENRPLFNRAVGGTYAPGSVYKMLTATAGLEEEIIGINDTIGCQGVYTYYTQYQPKCWIHEYGGGHGYLSVTSALGESCNCFFYDVGRRLTIDNLVNYTKRFGFGEMTGIELPGEEAKGRIAGPEDRELHPKDGDGTWYPGDTLQAAIGQSDHLFTPIQLATYVSTLVNGGVRYQPTLIRNVTSSKDGSILFEKEPEAIENIGISEETRNAVLKGMKLVASEGTAQATFADFNIEIGAKTGTAQVGRGSSNGVFVSFAPFDNPQIVVVTVVEHAGSGGNCAPIGKAIMDAYLNSENEGDMTTQKGTLLP